MLPHCFSGTVGICFGAGSGETPWRYLINNLYSKHTSFTAIALNLTKNASANDNPGSRDQKPGVLGIPSRQLDSSLGT